jgi:hypothetical protein
MLQELPANFAALSTQALMQLRPQYLYYPVGQFFLRNTQRTERSTSHGSAQRVAICNNRIRDLPRIQKRQQFISAVGGQICGDEHKMQGARAGGFSYSLCAWNDSTGTSRQSEHPQ